MEAHDDSTPWFLWELGHVPNHFLSFLRSLFSFLSSHPHSFVSLSAVQSPALRPWHPPGWRPSAARTETRRPSSWWPSSRSCSGRWAWGARLSASCLPFCNFSRSAKDTEDSGSIRCRGPRLPPGYWSSSACVTYWGAQVKYTLLARACFFF